jgi:hypothetical protein
MAASSMRLSREPGGYRTSSYKVIREAPRRGVSRNNQAAKIRLVIEKPKRGGTRLRFTTTAFTVSVSPLARKG